MTTLKSRLDLSNRSAFPELGAKTPISAPKSQTVASTKTTCSAKRSIFAEKPPQKADLIEAYWFAETSSKLGDRFADITVGYIYSVFARPCPLKNEDELIFAHYFDQLVLTDGISHEYLQKVEKTKKTIRMVIISILSEIKAKLATGAKFGLTDEQVFRGMWACGVENHVNARCTADEALAMLKNGRKDIQEMAEELYGVALSKYSKTQRDDLEFFSSFDPSFGKTIRDAAIEEFSTTLNKIVGLPQ